MTHADRFRFGVAAEFLLVDASTLAPLWHEDLRFSDLNRLLELIPVDDLPSCSGLRIIPPHRKAMPFLVAGHAVADDEATPIDVIVKGVKIRTPVCQSPRHVLSVLRELRSRLADVLWREGLRPVSLSHHPSARVARLPVAALTPAEHRAAKEEMFTYATEVRVGLPLEARSRIDIDDLHAKVRHYGPGLTAFSLAAPFADDSVWDTGDGLGKSRHIARRAPIAPSFAFDPDAAADLVFTALDASCRDADLHAYILLWLALLLDDTLASRGSVESHRRDMECTARLGFDNPATYARASILLDTAPAALARWGILSTPLEPLRERLEQRRCLSDDYVDWYREAGNLSAVIDKLAVRARARNLDR